MNPQIHNLKTVFLHVTHKCNLKCRHCYLDPDSTNQFELPKEEIFKLIKDFKKIKIKKIFLDGGEPFLRKDFLEIASYIKGCNIKVSTSTNGKIIDRVILNEVRDKIDTLNFSLDGYCASTHDYIRNSPGLFNRVIRNIRISVNLGIRLAVTCVVNRYNVKEAPDFINLSLKLGVKMIRFNYFTAFGRGIGFSRFALTAQEWMQLVNFLKEKQRRLAKRGVKIIYSPVFIEASKINHYKRPFCNLYRRERCYIDTSGEVYFCPLFFNETGFSLGNVLREGFSSIWNNSKNWQSLIKCNEANECQSCRYFKNCRSGCLAYRFLKAGSSRVKDPRCEIPLVPVCSFIKRLSPSP